MRITFHFRKNDLSISEEQIFLTKDPYDFHTGFWAKVANALQNYGGFLQYRNTFGETCFINMNKVERIDFK